MELVSYSHIAVSQERKYLRVPMVIQLYKVAMVTAYEGNTV